MLWSYAPLLGLTAGVTVAMQISFFIVAYVFQFDKVTDFAGASNFVLLSWLSYCLGVGAADAHTRQTVNTVLVTAWGVRLGLYLLARVLRRGHDARFDEMRANFWAFLGFWVFQMLWVWLVTLPVVLLNASTTDEPLNPGDYVGWALWGLGFVFETIGDHTKDAFHKDPRNKGRIITSGLWSLSRHPNYFGEITLWAGMFISCSSVFAANDANWAYVSVLSPVFTFTILMFGSGITLAEERYNRRHGNQPWYLEYRARTSPLIPFPPQLYVRLPKPVKAALFFDWPLYERGLERAETETNETTTLSVAPP